VDSDLWPKHVRQRSSTSSLFFLGAGLPRRVPVSALWGYRISLQRKKGRQQIIGPNNESFSVTVRIDAKKESVLGKMLGDAVRPALRVQPIRDDHLRTRLRSPPRKDHRGVNLISDALPFGRLWYGEPNAGSNAVDYAKFRSRSHDAVIRVYDESGKVIETH
jgi:hypothetical protein